MLEFFLKMSLNFITYILKRYNKSYLFKLKKFLLGIKVKVIYVVEEDSWAIEWVGKCITQNLKALGFAEIEITTPQIFKKKIIHFGSINCLIIKDVLFSVHGSNKVVLTPGKTMHTHLGVLAHDNLIGRFLGQTVKSHLGSTFYLLTPTLSIIILIAWIH